MKKILTPLLMIIFVIGGAVAGDFLKNKGSDTPSADTHEPKDNEKKRAGSKPEKSSKKAKKGKSADKGGKGDSAVGSGQASYIKFKRQFVVPVMTRGKIEALVIMNLNLELNSDAPSNAYSLEPKLRDAITRELLALSNQGIFGDNLTSAESYENIRKTLLSACEQILPEGIQDILILDIARQEQ